MPSDLILLRGLPGSGKSTLASVLSENRWPVYSVDDYFTAEDGRYSFQFEQNHLAYAECLKKTRKALLNGIDKVFVDNTFTLDWELEPYFKLASELGCRMFVVTVENYHGSSNLHQVSEEQVNKMAQKYKVKLH
ncbi:MAG TPA: ATP-binding protein [Bacteroidia bacterium]|nr:ATP-binding protein [Bacteroidia bacterium]